MISGSAGFIGSNLFKPLFSEMAEGTIVGFDNLNDYYNVSPQDYDFETHNQLVPMQPGDVLTTYADTTALERDFGFTPKTTLREGARKFAEWYMEFYVKDMYIINCLKSKL